MPIQRLPTEQRRRRRLSSSASSASSAVNFIMTTTTVCALLASSSRRSMVVSGWSTTTLAPITWRRNGLAFRRLHSFETSESNLARTTIRPSTVAQTTVARSLASSASNSNNDEKRKANTKNQKFKVTNEITQANMDKLAAAFDEMARKEGFDESMSYFADDETFDDAFADNDDDTAFDMDEEEKEEIDEVETSQETNDVLLDLDPLQFDLSDFTTDGGGDYEQGDDKMKETIYVNRNDDLDDDDMNSRLAAARHDMVTGRVSVPRQLENLAQMTSTANLGVLGFYEEADPYGIDEVSRKKEFQLVTEALVCSACGADFQSSNEHRPGYLPPEKFVTQVKLSKIEELQRLQAKAETDEEWTAEDEIEWLIRTADDGGNDEQQPKAAATDIDIPAMAEQLGLDLEDINGKKIICKRCHGLQNFGKVEDALRPGWTDEPLLAQEKFRDLLRPIREKPAVIIALVDLFDFSGSVLPELDNIAGDNPVILAANKADLLPSLMGPVRAENWVRRELEYLGIRSLANIGGSVRLVSCKTGAGVGGMLAKARRLADEMECDIYVVGAANAGKSTLMNHILNRNIDDKKEETGKLRAGNRNKRKDAITTSPLPGTTLKFIKVDLGGGRSLYDTPGLLVPGTLTQLLTPEELKIVVPKNQVEPITFRVSAGKAVLVGGLAKVELIDDSKPFLFSFFVANGIKLHPTDSLKADEFIEKHAGGILVPPLHPGPERMKQLGEFETHIINVEGLGWKEAAADISLTGLGWIAVTGAGTATVKISVPKGVGVSLRPPLMPFDIWQSTAKYTGSRAVRKSTKTKHGKRLPGVGRN